MASSPNLPGYRSNKTVAKPRNNKFSWDVKGNHRDGDWYASESSPSSLMRSETKDQYISKETVLDQTILCFNAFWREEVFDSNERFRFRFVRIFYVAEDGTLKVSERKSENSGLLQGISRNLVSLTHKPFSSLWRASANGKDHETGGYRS